MADIKFLDNNGLLYFWQKIKNSFALTTDIPTSLADLSADSTHRLVSDSEKSTWNGKQDAIVFNSTYNASSNKAATMNDIPDELADLTADSTHRLVTDTEKNTWNNKQNAIVFNTAYNASSNKAATMADVPTNNNQLTNGAGYQTASQVSTAINNAIAGITGISFEVVQSLPASGSTGTIYLVGNGGSTGNIYDEYIWVNNNFEKIGTTAIDLSNYLQKTDIVAITNSEIDTIVAS